MKTTTTETTEETTEQNGELSSRQLAMITLLISCSSIEEACRKGKISRPTVYSWLKNDAFKSELQRQRQEIYQEALEQLKAGVKRAVSKLTELVDSKKPEIAFRASSQIISYAVKLKELEPKTPESLRLFTAESTAKVWLAVRDRYVKPKVPLYNGIDQGNDATTSDENLQHNSLSNPPPQSTLP